MFPIAASRTPTGPLVSPTTRGEVGTNSRAANEPSVFTITSKGLLRDCENRWFAALIKSVPAKLSSDCSGQDCLAKYFRNQRGRRVGRFWDDAACGARQALNGMIRTDNISL